MNTPIFVITGTCGAGKTTVSTALMRRFELGLHIPIDDVISWVVSGAARPFGHAARETKRQFVLARQAARQTAELYADAGFAVAIDDIIRPPSVREHFERPLAPRQLYKVRLRPDVTVALARNATRPNKGFPAKVLEDVIHTVQVRQDSADYDAAGWYTLDSSHLTVGETVDHILDHFQIETRYAEKLKNGHR